MTTYTCRATPAGFRFAKFDELGAPVATHTVDPSGRFCDCPAGTRPDCRHRQMLQAFAAEGRIDSGWFYNPDEEEWEPPLQAEPPTSRLRRPK